MRKRRYGEVAKHQAHPKLVAAPLPVGERFAQQTDALLPLSGKGGAGSQASERLRDGEGILLPVGQRQRLLQYRLRIVEFTLLAALREIHAQADERERVNGPIILRAVHLRSTERLL